MMNMSQLHRHHHPYLLFLLLVKPLVQHIRFGHRHHFHPRLYYIWPDRHHHRHIKLLLILQIREW
jgi:hypothetical protein